MTRPLVESLFASERAVVHGVEGKTILYLGRDASLYSVMMLGDVLEIPRCPEVTASAALLGPRPPQVRTSSMAFREWVVERVVDGRRLLRAVHWPAYFNIDGTIISEEAIGVVMLDEPGRLPPTSKQWAAAVAHLRILERHVAR